MLPNGTEIDGRYTIERLIDSGQMGAVYVANRNEDEHPVAIKLIHPHWSENEEQVHRFQQEVVAASKVDHPGAIKIYDSGQYLDRPYFVMEFLRGTSLSDFMAAGALRRPEAFQTILQALAPLAVAHEAGLVHRDFKPENIFVLGAEEAEYRVKLLDFGVARQLDSDRATKVGLTMGTPRYMSPEQAANPQEVSFPSDVWACGIMLYRFATGTYPFSGKTPTVLLMNVVANPHISSADPRFGIPAPLTHIIERCLDKKPTRRFRTARALLAALETVSQNPAVAEWFALDVPISPDIEPANLGIASGNHPLPGHDAHADPRAQTAELPDISAALVDAHGVTGALPSNLEELAKMMPSDSSKDSALDSSLDDETHEPTGVIPVAEVLKAHRELEASSSAQKALVLSEKKTSRLQANTRENEVIEEDDGDSEVDGTIDEPPEPSGTQSMRVVDEYAIGDGDDTGRHDQTDHGSDTTPPEGVAAEAVEETNESAKKKQDTLIGSSKKDSKDEPDHTVMMESDTDNTSTNTATESRKEHEDTTASLTGATPAPRRAARMRFVVISVFLCAITTALFFVWKRGQTNPKDLAPATSPVGEAPQALPEPILEPPPKNETLASPRGGTTPSAAKKPMSDEESIKELKPAQLKSKPTTSPLPD